MSRGFGPLLPVVAFFAVALAFLACSRVLLVLWQWERVNAVGGFWPVLGYGLRMDTLILCYLMLVPAVLLLLLPPSVPGGRVVRPLALLWMSLVAVSLVFLEAATPSYIEQYGVRPSRIFIEYLVYPREVFSTLWAAYQLQLLAALILVAATAVFVWRLGNRLAWAGAPWRWWQRSLVLPLVVFAMFLGARSSLEHRPANASTAAFSGDPLVNDLALSSTFTVLNALYAMRHESDPARVYGSLSNADVVTLVRQAMKARFEDPAIPTLHRVAASRGSARAPNLVIVVEESLGAQFVGALGGLPLTPELDRLAAQGWWFTRLYATGTRSARGLEAIVTGFPPTPAQSVLKLSGAQDDFYTLARTLRRNGYITEFIYGGDSGFDNMAGFFLRNGFQRVIDEADYETPLFRGSWGVSDEDLFNRAHREFLAHGSEPFFAVVFSSSFHSPFEYPDGRVRPYEQPKATAHNAVRYADYALGQFFRQAKQAPYWDNTLFLVVADHDARVYGASLVPIERFHIPGLILGKGAPRRRYSSPASQIDLAPTLLSLMGIDAAHPMIGQDLTQAGSAHQGRAIMQYENNHAYLKGDRVVIHEPHKAPHHFRYAEGRLQPVPADDTLAREALAHILWPALAYRERQYRLPVGSTLARRQR